MEVSFLMALLWLTFYWAVSGMLVCSLTSISCAAYNVLSALLRAGINLCFEYSLYVTVLRYDLVRSL